VRHFRWLPFGEKEYFNQADFERDSARLIILYKRSGYPDVKIRTALKRSTDAVDVTFRITQGAPVILKHFDIYGLDSVEKAYQIRQDLPIAAGDVASDWKLHEARDTIESRLRDRGYPRVRVELVEAPHGDTAARQVQENARINVHTGRFSRFGSIRVEAPPEVDTSFVASLVSARPGNTFRLKDIVTSQRTLYAADLFRVASVSIDTTRYDVNDTLNVTDSIVPISVSVVPSLGHRATAQVGYGTDDCFRTGVGWTARNFIDEGLIFDVAGQLSKIGVGSPLGAGFQNNLCSGLRDDSIGSRVANYGLNASLHRSAFLSPDNSITLSLFATQHSEFEVYLRQEVGASLSFTRNGSSNVPVTLTYRIADGTTSANPASFCAFFNTCEPAAIAALQQRRVQGTLTLSVLRQRLNNPLDPQRGSVLSAAITTSSRFLGSSTTQQFTRLIGDAAGFLPLRRDVVLAGHVRGGIIFAPVSGIGTDVGNFVPPDQRFYAGGSNDVRGYDQNQLGPLVYVVPADSVKHVAAGDTIPASAVRVAPTGGTRVVIGNLELRLPTPLFAGRLRYVLFVDAGALWNSGGAAPLRVTPGVGLRYGSPIGPIRLDVGYNTYPLQAGTLFAVNTDGTLTSLRTDYVKPSSGRWTLHVAIGEAFF
jgi:outer membrane protein insertion porin family/translocation and assembly module TamA